MLFRIACSFQASRASSRVGVFILLISLMNFVRQLKNSFPRQFPTIAAPIEINYAPMTVSVTCARKGIVASLIVPRFQVACGHCDLYSRRFIFGIIRGSTIIVNLFLKVNQQIANRLRKLTLFSGQSHQEKQYNITMIIATTKIKKFDIFLLPSPPSVPSCHWRDSMSTNMFLFCNRVNQNPSKRTPHPKEILYPTSFTIPFITDHSSFP